MASLNDRSVGIASAILLLSAPLAGCEQHRQSPPPPPAILGTYARNCASPPSGWRNRPSDLADKYWAEIRLDGVGRTSWNGTDASVEVIRGYIHRFEGPASELAFVPAADAKCADVERIRHMMSELAMCHRPGRCVEGEKNLPPPVY